MTDPLTTFGISAAAAYAGKDVLRKLLGPTADYLGEGLRDLVQKRVETVKKIFDSAVGKLEDRIEQPGVVPPKIIKGIIADGSFATEDVEVEYFAGILAASRTPDGNDDRGVRALKTLANLSSYQIRTHYIVYSCIVASYFGSSANINNSTEARKLQVLFAFDRYFGEMGISDTGQHENLAEFANDVLSHALHGLLDDGLIANNVAWGSAEHIRHSWVTKPGIAVAPTRSGLELFRLGIGASRLSTAYVLRDPELQAKIDQGLIERMKPETP